MSRRTGNNYTGARRLFSSRTRAETRDQLELDYQPIERESPGVREARLAFEAELERLGPSTDAGQEFMARWIAQERRNRRESIR